MLAVPRTGSTSRAEVSASHHLGLASLAGWKGAPSLQGGCSLLTLCEAELGNPMQVLQEADSRAGEKIKNSSMVKIRSQGATGPLRWKVAASVDPSLKGVQMVRCLAS